MTFWRRIKGHSKLGPKSLVVKKGVDELHPKPHDTWVLVEEIGSGPQSGEKIFNISVETADLRGLKPLKTFVAFSNPAGEVRLPITVWLRPSLLNIFLCVIAVLALMGQWIPDIPIIKRWRNAAPKIAKIIHDDRPVHMGEEIYLEAIVDDEDKTSLKYYWEPKELIKENSDPARVTFSTSDSSIYRGLDSSKYIEFSLRVQDEYDKWSERKIVKIDLKNTPPVIKAIVIVGNKTRFNSGEEVLLEVNDDDDDVHDRGDLDRTWSSPISEARFTDPKGKKTGLDTSKIKPTNGPLRVPIHVEVKDRHEARVKDKREIDVVARRSTDTQPILPPQIWIDGEDTIKQGEEGLFRAEGNINWNYAHDFHWDKGKTTEGRIEPLREGRSATLHTQGINSTSDSCTTPSVIVSVEFKYRQEVLHAKLPICIMPLTNASSSNTTQHQSDLPTKNETGGQPAREKPQERDSEGTKKEQGSGQEEPNPQPEPKFINAEMIEEVKPIYPERAIQQRASGLVTVQVTINEKGDVIHAKAIDGDMLLRKAAEEAAMKCKFKPATEDGRPVVSRAKIPFSFRFKED
jgi:TonB family protein